MMMAQRSVRATSRASFSMDSAGVPQISLAHASLGGLVVGAQHVIEEIVLRIGALGHVVGVETDAAALEEVPIDERVFLRIVLGEQDIAHGQHHGAVRTGTDADELIGQNARRGVVVHVHGDELRARGLALHVVIGLNAGAAPRGVRGPQHNELARAQVHAIVHVLGKADAVFDLGPGS